MHKRPAPAFRQSHEPNPKERQLFEVKSLQDNKKHHNTQAYTPSPQQVQNYHQNRTKSDTKKSSRSMGEDRNTYENHQENSVRRSIYNRFSNQEVLQVEEDPQEETEENTDRGEQQEHMQQLPQGYQQMNANSFHSQENALRGLEDQYHQISRQNDALKKQMALLEMSLHNETLTNEEQRAYIEVLKQALETKMSENGLLGFIKSLRNRSNLTEADLFIELTNIKSLVDNNERDKSINEERTRELYGQLEQLSKVNEKFRNDKARSDQEIERMSREMTQAIQDLEILRNENEKLSHEKEALLDYIEEIRSKYEQVDEENNLSKESAQNFESKVTKLQSKTQELTDKLIAAEERNYNTVQDYEELNRAHLNLQKKFEELQKRHEELQQEHNNQGASMEQLMDKLNKSKIEHQSLLREHETLKTEHEDLEQNLSNLQQAHEDHSNKMELVLKDSGVMTIEREELIKEVERLQDVNEEFEENQIALQEKIAELTGLVTEYKAVAERVGELEQLNSNLEKEIAQFKMIFEENKVKNEKDRQTKADEIKSLYQQASDLRIELRSQKEECHRLEVERDGLVSSNNDLNQELEKKQRMIIGYLKELNDFKQIAEERQEQLDLKVEQIDRFEAQVEELNGFVEECDEKVKRAYEAEEKLTKDLELLTKENRKLKDENTTMHQRHDKVKRELEQTKLTVSEILKVTGNTSSVNVDNLELGLRLINERVRDMKHEEEIQRKRVEDIEYESSLLQKEISRLEEKNAKLNNSEVQINTENKKLRGEIEKLKDEINEQQSKNENMRTEFEKLQRDFERKIREDDYNFKEQAKVLEDKVTRLVSQRSALEFIVSKYIEVTLNAEINDLLEQARNAHIQISHLDKEKLDIQLKMDVLKSPGKVYERGTPSRGSEATKRRDIEALKENIADIDSNIEIYETKKQSLENEVARIMIGEREKYFAFYDLEKQNNQLRAELELISKENQMITQARDSLEASYNELIKGMRRSRVEERLNASLCFPEGTFAKKNQFERSEYETSKRNSDGVNSNPGSLRKDYEGRTSHVSSARRYRKDDNNMRNSNILK